MEDKSKAKAVAEGPAATPRLPIATDHCLQCGIHLAPEEELGGLCSRHKPSSTSVTFPAAAEPPEARAAAHEPDWDDAIQQNDAAWEALGMADYDGEDSLAHFIRIWVARVADLQRQLDEARCELEKAGSENREYERQYVELQKRFQSAEAANQELRRFVAKLTANMHSDAFTTSDLRKEAAALLGHQHGQKEKL